MPSSSLKKLKTAAEKNPGKPNSTLLDEGETRWFAGRARKSSDETTCLVTENDLEITIRDDDILEIVEDEGIFLLRIRNEADIVLQLRAATKASLNSGCDCAHTNAQTQASGSTHAGIGIFGSGDGGDTAPGFPSCVLRIVWRCKWARTGPYIKVCIPYPVQVCD